MIQVASGTKVYLACRPVSMRYGFDGLAAQAVDGHVLIYIHKEAELPKVFERYPSDHYVVVDDKPRITSAFERECPTLFTTVLVLQGKYAHPDQFEPRPDYVVAHIADLRHFSRDQFLTPTRAAGQT